MSIMKWFNGEEPFSSYGKIKLGEIYLLKALQHAKDLWTILTEWVLKFQS